MLYNVNIYEEQEFRTQFAPTDIYKQITALADEIRRDKHVPINYKLTPRRELWIRTASVNPFYYLHYIFENNPNCVYDIGCGMNWFKLFYPTIHGIGEETIESGNFYGDEHGNFDTQWARAHENQLEGLFAINSLHFIRLGFLKQRVEQVISCLRKGARAYLTFSTHAFTEMYINYTAEQAVMYIRAELSKITGVLWIVVDIDDTADPDPLDGNIRLVLEKL